MKMIICIHFLFRYSVIAAAFGHVRSELTIAIY